jgi:hypothetical protein
LREKIHNRATVKPSAYAVYAASTSYGGHGMRIVTTSAVFLALAAGGASAQTATTTAPSKPLPLLQIVQQKDDAAAVTPHPRARYARRKVVRTRITHQKASAMHHAYMQVQSAPEPEQAAATPAATTPPATKPAAEMATAATAATTTAAVPANIWPAPDFTLPGMQAQTLTLAPPPAPIAAFNEPVAATDATETLTASNQTVQLTPPIATPVTPQDTPQIMPSNAIDSTDITADRQHESANTAGPTDAAATWPVQRAMVATAEPQTPRPVGSASWIAHVLAALVGAIATGTLAWVLIDPLPARGYE